jgi:hypothetical protein
MTRPSAGRQSFSVGFDGPQNYGKLHSYLCEIRGRGGNKLRYSAFVGFMSLIPCFWRMGRIVDWNHMSTQRDEAYA